MSTTSTKTPKKIAYKAVKDSEPKKVTDISVIVEKTYRMAETLKNVRLPGE